VTLICLILCGMFVAIYPRYRQLGNGRQCYLFQEWWAVGPPLLLMMIFFHLIGRRMREVDDVYEVGREILVTQIIRMIFMGGYLIATIVITYTINDRAAFDSHYYSLHMVVIVPLTADIMIKYDIDHISFVISNVLVYHLLFFFFMCCIICRVL
jgi:hypothetical protein